MVQNYQPANSSWQFQDYYACLFKAKVNSWRSLFREPELFYGFVSLAAYGSDDSDDTERSADGLPRIRLDQNSILALPNTAVVHYAPLPPCRIHTVHVWRILHGGVWA